MVANTAAYVPIAPSRRAGVQSTHVFEIYIYIVLDFDKSPTPPSGANLLSALGDIAGFVHTSLTTPPSTTYAPIERTNTSIDYAEQSPSTIVRVGSSPNSCGNGP